MMILDGVGSRYIHAIVVATCPRPLAGTATFAIRQVTLKQSTGEEMEKLERRDNHGAPIAAMLKTTLVSWRHKAIAFLPTAFLSSTQGSIEKSFARSSYGRLQCAARERCRLMGRSLNRRRLRLGTFVTPMRRRKKKTTAFGCRYKIEMGSFCYDRK